MATGIRSSIRGKGWTYQAQTTVTAGQHANVGTVNALDPLGRPLNDRDFSHHFGIGNVDSSIDIEKSTNGHDADAPTGPVLSVGSTAVFTYVVTNTGAEPLTNVVVSDDQLGSITNLVSNGNGDSILDPGESWTYQAQTTVTEGQHANVGTVNALDLLGRPLNDRDFSHHFGIGNVDSSIDIEKSTNGHDADVPTGPVLSVGSTAVFIYVVTNTGAEPLTNVVVSDDQLVVRSPSSSVMATGIRSSIRGRVGRIRLKPPSLRGSTPTLEP